MALPALYNVINCCLRTSRDGTMLVDGVTADLDQEAGRKVEVAEEECKSHNRSCHLLRFVAL